MNQPPLSVGDVDGFVRLLSVACEESDVYETLEKILALPDERRKLVLRALLSDMRKAQAPQDFAAAIACLLDDAVAEKAYEVIFKCKRGLRFRISSARYSDKGSG